MSYTKNTEAMRSLIEHTPNDAERNAAARIQDMLQPSTTDLPGGIVLIGEDKIIHNPKRHAIAERVATAIERMERFTHESGKRFTADMVHASTAALDEIKSGDITQAEGRVKTMLKRLHEETAGDASPLLLEARMGLATAAADLHAYTGKPLEGYGGKQQTPAQPHGKTKSTAAH